MKFKTGIPATIGLVIAASVVLAACSSFKGYPTRNVQATQLNDTGQTWFPPQRGETIIVVTISGGGTRATALGLSTLRGLAEIKLRSGERMVDNIDVLSSVSGGSVAAGYFALKGVDGLQTLEDEFVRKPGISALVGHGLNPFQLFRLSTAGTERIDLLIEYLDERLFHGATFADLARRPMAPFLVLNAGDMVEGTPFAFTYYNFNLLCSDLRKLPLSTAVAASAAFPVALSPVTLTNHSRCPAQADPWPPHWARNNANTNWQLNPVRAMRGRVERAYAVGTKRFIHLLDGGITDNLGMAEPYRLLTQFDVAPSYATRISQGRVKRVIWVVVNARSAPPSDLDSKPDTPGIGAMLMGTVSSAIDSRTSASLYQIKYALEAGWKEAAADFEGQPELQRNFSVVARNLHIASVDFDAIERVACRQAFQSIPTSWTLEAKQVDAVLLMGQALLMNDGQFRDALREVGATPPPNFPTVDRACDALSANVGD